MSKYSAAEVRKFIVAAVGFILTVLTTVLTVNANLIPESWLPWVTVFIAVCSAYGVFQVPNRPSSKPSRQGVQWR